MPLARLEMIWLRSIKSERARRTRTSLSGGLSSRMAMNGWKLGGGVVTCVTESGFDLITFTQSLNVCGQTWSNWLERKAAIDCPGSAEYFVSSASRYGSCLLVRGSLRK